MIRELAAGFLNFPIGKSFFDFAISFLPSSFLSFIVISSLVTTGRGDYAAHTAFALNTDDPRGSYSLVFPLIRFAEWIIPIYGVSVLGSIFMGLTSTLIYYFLRTRSISRTVSVLIAFSSSFIMPLPTAEGLLELDLQMMRIYLGQLAPNQFHNITTLAMMPFAFATVWVLSETVTQQRLRRWRGGSMVLFSFCCPLLQNLTLRLRLFQHSLSRISLRYSRETSLIESW